MLARYVRRNVAWVDCVSPTPAEVRTLMHEFGFEPEVAEELLLPSFKPRLERRGESVYLILHFPHLRGSQERPEQEIDFIIGKHFLLTVRYETVDPLHSFAKVFEVESVLGGDGSITHGGHLFAAMLRNLYQALGQECDTLSRRLRDIEEHIFNGDERRMVVELSRVGRAIHDFRQALAPHAEILAALEAPLMKLFGPEYSHHLKTVTAAYDRTRHHLENLRDALMELRETNNSLVSTKHNEIMRTLTMLALLTFPLSLIAGIFSMNTRFTPLVGSPNDFWIILGIMALVALGFLMYFRRKDWL